MLIVAAKGDKARMRRERALRALRRAHRVVNGPPLSNKYIHRSPMRT